jgi:DNA-binding NtrC family response regulator
LRDLGEDKLLLLQHFSRFYARESGLDPFTLDSGATRLWLDYSFPGNVRELRNIVIRLCTKHPGKDVTTDQLVSELDWEDTDAAPPSPRTDSAASTDAARQRLQTDKNFQLDQLLKELERSYVEAALELSSGNLSKAARMLGIHRTTLYSRMQSYEQPTREDS